MRRSRSAFRAQPLGVDLRLLPKTIPVPHVESVLALDYDTTGQFRDPFIAGRATFGRSEFLGAAIAAGTTGSVDTSRQPVHFAGEGDIDSLSIRRFGEGLDVGWMRDPRFASVVAGHFHVDVIGTDSRTMTLTGGGRLSARDRVQRLSVGCRRVRRDRGRHSARDLRRGVREHRSGRARSTTSDTRRR